MVRSLANNPSRLTPETMLPGGDWLLSPKAMRGYLQYRLYVIERQIDGLMRELERRDAPPFPADLDDNAYPDRAWAMWANLNYLLRAREALQEALSKSQRKLN